MKSKFIKGSEIIDNVKERLYSYSDSDMVDESLLFKTLGRLLSGFRFNVYPICETVLVVKDCKADLPEDFFQACYMSACFEYTCDSHNRFNETYSIEEEEVCSLNVCETVCDVCSDSCGNLLRIVQKFNRFPTRVYKDFHDVRLTKGSLKWCASDTPIRKSRGSNVVDIQNGSVMTEFEEGLIYMVYVQDLDTGDDYMIPYHPKVEDWLETALMADVLSVLYYNGEDNVYQRYQNMRAELGIKEENARAILKRPEYDEMYRVVNHLVGRYNRVRRNVFDPEVHSVHYYGYNPTYPKGNVI